MKKILIVDDSETVRQQVANTLGQAGFQVFQALDGVDGVEKINADASFNLVICDVNMARLDGLAMLERVKSNPRTASIPVMMLTTEGHPSLITRAKKAGAKGWVIKPFKADLFVAAVKRLVST